MNKEQTKQAIAVMQGFIDGKTIQYSPYDNGEWKNVSRTPCWEWHRYNYRLKPEVVKYRRYLWKTNDNLARVSATSEEKAVKSISKYPSFIRWIDTEWQEVEV
jgi:hypothetical protein